MTKIKWKKAYKGPFTLKEADELIDDLKKTGVFEGIMKRKRPHQMKWDIYIQA